ncbi:transcriptional regulator SplA domain-containing protein [Heyndrickxia ginsengihumi]|uniref:Transcriptional regulator n=1 Tax=Heyndrickxia ginsengihumi TaxID=363870 RepID=A0A0A6VAC7_9BACI|nr:transcriptional regulator SplA domain-containing protein [Heyndrickxia ginsengihumi]KHD85200.1 hypothetical protein NG54_10585 [Heyndrickxia ginsengihumi]MBE6183965.1 transcriptional regulator [Bacillus sp. (in: firmicutes)]MCM3021771.1 transcriptional regulator [Heyndrickxia ginsengihumi]NEY19704.1 transcriptional regulator [Heyndrickxia ginsengihumi]
MFFSNFTPGEIVYVIYRNPHIQNVANIQEAAVVQDPENTEQLSLFLYETFYPLTNTLAIYKTKAEAEEAYEYYFGEVDHLGGLE